MSAINIGALHNPTAFPCAGCPGVAHVRETPNLPILPTPPLLGRWTLQSGEDGAQRLLRQWLYRASEGNHRNP